MFSARKKLVLRYLVPSHILKPYLFYFHFWIRKVPIMQTTRWYEKWQYYDLFAQLKYEHETSLLEHIKGHECSIGKMQQTCDSIVSKVLLETKTLDLNAESMEIVENIEPEWSMMSRKWSMMSMLNWATTRAWWVFLWKRNSI